jgi:predicted signal transduction protein with EAL and GGDEF domain
MSLLKQLLISVTLAILVILAGSLVLSINSSRQYLQEQLIAQSDNAVSSLALTLSQPGNQDTATRELLMMALFDSGQFSSIRLESPDNQVLFERGSPETESRSGRAPAWFVRQISWAVPIAVREISDGWTQVGRLSVTIDNRFALDALWKSSSRQLILVLSAGLAWSLFVALLLGWFKRVLRDEIALKVSEIGTRTTSVLPQPSLEELRPVVRAINDTRERVLAANREQTDRIESLELELHLDEVTHLPNRKYFMSELKRVLSEGHGAEGSPFGHVLLFRQRDLSAINAVMTRAGADSWLGSIGVRVSEYLRENKEANLRGARLNGSDFVILLPGLSGPHATRLVQNLRNALVPMRICIASEQWSRWAFALVDYGVGCSAESIMSRADNALMRAESLGHGDVEYVTIKDDAGGPAVTGETGWRGLIVDALSKDHFALTTQSMIYNGNRSTVVHTVASLVIKDAAQDDLPGHLFFPAAVRLGLTANCNLRALDLGLRWLADHEGDLVIKVSMASLSQAAFLSGLRDRLQGPLATSQRRARLTLELEAYSLIACLDDVISFSDILSQNGVKLGLRRIAQHPAALVHLHRLELDYIKLNGDFMELLSSSPGSERLFLAMLRTSSGLGVKVLVQAPLNGGWYERAQARGGYVFQLTDANP